MCIMLCMRDVFFPFLRARVHDRTTMLMIARSRVWYKKAETARPLVPLCLADPPYC